MIELVAAALDAELEIGTTREAFAAALDAPMDPDVEHVTAIAWVIDDATTSLLLVRHRLHGWSCPGGHVEPGEHPFAAAARELEEETGVRAAPEPRVLTVSSSWGCARRPGARHWAVGLRFVVPAGEPLRSEPGQTARWFRLDDLPVPRPLDVDIVAAHLRGRRTG